MTDLFHGSKTSKITQEEIDRYITEAHRLRGAMLRETALRVAGFFRHGLERSRKNIRETASNLKLTDASRFMPAKGGLHD